MSIAYCSRNFSVLLQLVDIDDNETREFSFIEDDKRRYLVCMSYVDCYRIIEYFCFFEGYCL